MAIQVRDRIESIPQDIIDAYKSIGVGDIGHIQNFGFMDTDIRPVWRDIRLVGPALTVRMPPMDITANRIAIQNAGPGDVIVVDRLNTTEDACWGGVAALLAKVQGAAGLIVDGAVTDTMELADLEWPVYSRSVSGLVGRVRGDDGIGEINVPISCGGVAVNPGDLIVADDDGIVVIRPHEAADLLKAVQDRFGSHPNIRQWIRDGKDLRDYPHARQFFGTDE
jgi:4-hydroxy-4-methyl-2-oxoglutarate aldolase